MNPAKPINRSGISLQRPEPALYSWWMDAPREDFSSRCEAERSRMARGKCASWVPGVEPSAPDRRVPMRRLLTAASLVLALASSAWAQAVVKNPRTAEFECAEHDRDTEHELDILRADGTVLATILLGDPPAVGLQNGLPLVRASINVMPVEFGTGYTARVRAVAGPYKSENSAVSNVFERVPGKPGQVLVGGL